MNFKNLSTLNIKILNFLILFYPVALVAGNFLTNLCVILVCIFGILAYKEKIFSLDQIKSNAFIFLFFIILVCITILNFELNKGEDSILKSLLYFRYFIFLLVIKSMIESNDIDIKRFFIFSLFLMLFICLDILFQVITGKNFFGMVGNIFSRHHSGIFGKEFIAGSFIQRLSLFAIFCIPLVVKKMNNTKLFIIFSLILIFFITILFSGNRMPFLLFFISMFLVLFFIKELRKVFAVGILFCSLFFIFSLYLNEQVLKNYGGFYNHSQKIIYNIVKFSGKKYPELENKKYKNFNVEYNAGKDSEKLKKKYEILPFGSGHSIVFLTAIDIWNDNIFFGNGLKSFKIKCKTKLHIPNRVCTSHPHNYYLELFNDTGVVGSLILLIGVFLMIKNKIYNFRTFTYKEKLFVYSILIILITEFFPLRSSGGFFTTSNSSFIFFLLGLLSGFKSNKKII